MDNNQEPKFYFNKKLLIFCLAILVLIVVLAIVITRIK